MKKVYQYYHSPNQDYTACIDITGLKPQALTPDNIIKLYVGFAKKHPDDNYNKAIGREVAKGRMELHSFEPINDLPNLATAISVNPAQKIHEYISEDGSIQLVMRTNERSKNIHVLQCRNLQFDEEWFDYF